MEDRLDRLPADVEIRLISIQMEHLNSQYDALLKLTRSHEVELAILWCSSIGVMTYLLLDKIKENHGR